MPEPAPSRRADHGSSRPGLPCGPVEALLDDRRPDHPIPAEQRVRPLPDGNQYLGFIFAEAGTRHEVEQALTSARSQLRVIID